MSARCDHDILVLVDKIPHFVHHDCHRGYHDTGCIVIHFPKLPIFPHLSGKLLVEQVLEGLAVLGEALDTLPELISRHLVLGHGLLERLLVVDERHLLLLVLGRRLGLELLGDGLASTISFMSLL